jgi:hypothetical protein
VGKGPQDGQLTGEDMRHIIDDNMAIIIWETKNRGCDPRSAEGGEPTERYSYLVEYKDVADKPRESEICNGFFSPDHCIQDALSNLDALDLTPEPTPEPREPRITQKYHYHLCSVGCPNHRCVNSDCYSKEEFPRRVAEIICPACGEQTGARNFFERRRFAIAEFIPLVIESSAA